MSTSNKRKTTAPHFIWIEERLRKTPAWLSLSRKAIQTYMFLRSKTIGTIYGDACDKDITKAYSTIQKETGLNRGQVRAALLELNEKGFIDLIVRGGLKSAGYTMNTYRLSIRVFDWGTPDFKLGTMKKEAYGGRGWDAYHKQKTSNEIDTSASNETVTSRRKGQKGALSTSNENVTSRRKPPVMKSLLSIDIPCTK